MLGPNGLNSNWFNLKPGFKLEFILTRGNTAYLFSPTGSIIIVTILDLIAKNYLVQEYNLNFNVLAGAMTQQGKIWLLINDQATFLIQLDASLQIKQRISLDTYITEAKLYVIDSTSYIVTSIGAFYVNLTFNQIDTLDWSGFELDVTKLTGTTKLYAIAYRDQQEYLLILDWLARTVVTLATGTNTTALTVADDVVYMVSKQGYIQFYTEPTGFIRSQSLAKYLAPSNDRASAIVTTDTYLYFTTNNIYTYLIRCQLPVLTSEVNPNLDFEAIPIDGTFASNLDLLIPYQEELFLPYYGLLHHLDLNRDLVLLPDLALPYLPEIKDDSPIIMSAKALASVNEYLWLMADVTLPYLTVKLHQISLDIPLLPTVGCFEVVNNKVVTLDVVGKNLYCYDLIAKQVLPGLIGSPILPPAPIALPDLYIRTFDANTKKNKLAQAVTTQLLVEGNLVYGLVTGLDSDGNYQTMVFKFDVNTRAVITKLLPSWPASRHGLCIVADHVLVEGFYSASDSTTVIQLHDLTSDLTLVQSLPLTSPYSNYNTKLYGGVICYQGKMIGYNSYGLITYDPVNGNLELDWLNLNISTCPNTMAGSYLAVNGDTLLASGSQKMYDDTIYVIRNETITQLSLDWLFYQPFQCVASTIYILTKNGLVTTEGQIIAPFIAEPDAITLAEYQNYQVVTQGNTLTLTDLIKTNTQSLILPHHILKVKIRSEFILCQINQTGYDALLFLHYKT